MGKGSSARPFSISQMNFAKNYELTFGKKNRNETRETATRETIAGGEANTGTEQTASADSHQPRRTTENDS